MLTLKRIRKANNNIWKSETHRKIKLKVHNVITRSLLTLVNKSWQKKYDCFGNDSRMDEIG